jgi:hypothetical protein
MLGRDDFCKLTGIASVEALKSRLRRGQLPVWDGGDQHKPYGYTFFDAFTTRIADRLVAVGMNPAAAAIVAREIAPALAKRWVDIATSAAFLDADSEIEWLHVSHPGDGSTTASGPRQP